MKKFIFITGGVLSSLGKGLTAASIGALLEAMGYSVSFLKLDPYLNVDPGTMSPFQHGEVFVTHDGAETDLDLGHYERFTHTRLRAENSITSGKLYAHLIEKERRGDFLGGTIQIIPHLTDAIKEAFHNASNNSDITLVEIGGTVGDIEGLPFIEAIRQMGLYEGRKNCLYIHLTYIPYLAMAQELKTKPTQHAIKELRSLGIQPDILIGRSEKPLSNDIKKKIALFTQVPEHAIISACDLTTIYELPLHLAEQQVPETIARFLSLEYRKPDLKKWFTLVNSIKSAQKEITIALIGKYTGSADTYKSLHEALIHAQSATHTKAVIRSIDSQQLTQENIAEHLQGIDALIIPGGFGNRGIEGKIIAARYAREHNIPFLGICLGMQVAVIEFARNVLQLADADSTEFSKTNHPVVDVMAEQKEVTHKGATMRLGAQECTIKPATLAYAIYQQKEISERHRHRYEFNSAYAERFQKAGLIISGKHASSEDSNSELPEIIEIPSHKHFIACQFHPELQSKPFAPHPLFVSLLKACLQ